VVQNEAFHGGNGFIGQGREKKFKNRWVAYLSKGGEHPLLAKEIGKGRVKFIESQVVGKDVRKDNLSKRTMTITCADDSGGERSCE